MSKEKLQEERNINFYFNKSADWKLQPISGIFGGVHHTGMLTAHLFFEDFPIPTVLKNKLDINSGTVTEVGREYELSPDEGDFTREIMFTAIMRPEVAFSIGSWLVERSKRFLEEQSQVVENTEENE